MIFVTEDAVVWPFFQLLLTLSDYDVGGCHSEVCSFLDIFQSFP